MLCRVEIISLNVQCGLKPGSRQYDRSSVRKAFSYILEFRYKRAKLDKASPAKV